MKVEVIKSCNLFERKGSHTFCVSKAIIRYGDDCKHVFLKAAGVAVCNKIDEYNLEFGKALAQSRADKRLDRKIEKFLVKLSEKNGKKKSLITKQELWSAYIGSDYRSFSSNEIDSYRNLWKFLEDKGVVK